MITLSDQIITKQEKKDRGGVRVRLVYRHEKCTGTKFFDQLLVGSRSEHTQTRTTSLKRCSNHHPLPLFLTKTPDPSSSSIKSWLRVWSTEGRPGAPTPLCGPGVSEPWFRHGLHYVQRYFQTVCSFNHEC